MRHHGFSCSSLYTVTPEQAQGNLLIELVASFVNRSNLLKSWEKTDPCAVSTSGAHGPKNTAITRIPPTLCHGVARIFLSVSHLSNLVLRHVPWIENSN